MSVNLDPQTRQERTAYFRSLKERVLSAAQAKRQRHDPHAWANTFAGRPREFIGELISDWEGPDWVAWRAFISAVFCEPFQSDEELRIFQECTALEEQPEKRPPSVWMPVGRRGGKACWVNTPIPTPSGWTTMGKLQAGDQVYDEQGQPCRVTHAHPVMLGRPCYRVSFSDGSSIVADADHLWTTQTARARKAIGRNQSPGLRTRWTSQDMLLLLAQRAAGVSCSDLAVQFNRSREAIYQAVKRRNRYIPAPADPSTLTTEQIRDTLYLNEDGDLNHSIPCCQPLLGAPVNLPLDGYLLGLWLGDGHSAQAAITTPDPEVVAAFEAAGYRLAPSPSTAERTAPTYHIDIEEERQYAGRARTGRGYSTNTFTALLRRSGVFGDKHIPAVYLRAPITDRIALLQGLMDSDGYCDDRGHAEYCSTNTRLARDVWELCLSLGLKAGLSHEQAMLYGRDMGPKHRVTFIPYDDFPVFRLPRKLSNQRSAGQRADQTKRRYITAVEPVLSVPVRCITVDSPSELYLVGETMIPTHNSRMLAAIAVHLGTCYDWSQFLDPGEVGVLPVLAADRRQARTIMGYVKAFLEHPQLKELVAHDSAESIHLKGNILIEVVTASYRAVRSRTIIAALLDEVAFWHSEESSVNPDTEIIAALEPAMATIPNALLLGASSPYSRRGVLYNNFEKHYGKPGGPLIWKAATAVMNPTVPQSFLDEKYLEDPLAAAAEYGAEFRSDVDAFITKEALDSALRETHEWPPRPGFQYFGFVDPSGGSSDSMTLAIGHIDKDTRKGVLDLIRERRPQFSPEGVAKEYSDLLKLYRCFKVEGDHYGGEWPREQFRKHGVNYQVSERNKSDIYLEFLPLLNAGRCELLDNRRMYGQFLGLERRTARGGHESIDHQPGGYDDVCNVVAGVMVRMLAKGNPTNIDPGVLAKSARIVTRHSLDRLTPGPQWR